MIDMAVSIRVTGDESDAVSASIRVSMGERAQPEGQGNQSHRDSLGVGPLLPEGSVGCHIPGAGDVGCVTRMRNDR
jgi:hypothetical protein